MFALGSVGTYTEGKHYTVNGGGGIVPPTIFLFESGHDTGTFRIIFQYHRNMILEHVSGLYVQTHKFIWLDKICWTTYILSMCFIQEGTIAPPIALPLLYFFSLLNNFQMQM